MKKIGSSFLILNFFIACFFLQSVRGQVEILWEEKFDFPDGELPPEWWSEGVPASIREGRLLVEGDILEPRVATVWLDREFSGNLQIEFDVHVLSSAELANNLNFFLLYSDPGGKNLRETQKERMDGDYAKYHKLNGYIFTHLVNGQESPARFRFRHNPGFTLLKELYAFECRTATNYRIKLVKMCNSIQYWAYDNLIIDLELEKELLYQKGIIGFRTYRTTLWWDNLVVRRLGI